MGELQQSHSHEGQFPLCFECVFKCAVCDSVPLVAPSRITKIMAFFKKYSQTHPPFYHWSDKQTIPPQTHAIG